MRALRPRPESSDRPAALLLAALLLFAARPGSAQEEYGAKGIFPIYESGGQWLIFDKKPAKKKPSPLGVGGRFLVIGSQGAQVFEVARTSGTYGGACRQRRPLKLRAALLKGPRSAVGRPIIGIRVPASFSLKGSRAAYLPLANAAGEETYRRLGQTIKQSVMEDVRSRAFRFQLDDAGGPAFLQDPRPEKIQLKIDFGSRTPVQGLKDPFLLIEESQISASSRRCLRLAEGERLIGGCAEMPRTLMAETALLEFVSYDPSGKKSPYLLAFTRTQPLWGDERWGFVIRETGPSLFLTDSMDIRCREGF